MKKPRFVISFLDSQGRSQQVVYDKHPDAEQALKYLESKGAKRLKMTVNFVNKEEISNGRDKSGG